MIKKVKLFLCSGLFVLVMLSEFANASLIGEEITLSTGAAWTEWGWSNFEATIGPEIEFYYHNTSWDFGEDTLTIINTSSSWNVGWANAGIATFSNFSSNIGGIEILSNDGFSGGILQSSFTENQIMFDMTSLSLAKPNAKLVFRTYSGGMGPHCNSLK